MSEMLARAAAAQSTADKYIGKAFAYGRYDCVRMVAHHLREMGYKPGLARGGSYLSHKGAVAALKRAGFDTIEQALDSLGLERIPPARAVTGDIGKFRGPDPFGGLMIYAGNGRTLGYHEQQPGAVFMQPREPAVVAWRVTPRAAAALRHVARAKERMQADRAAGR